MRSQAGDSLQAIPEVVHRFVNLPRTGIVVLQLHPAHRGTHLVHPVLVPSERQPRERRQVLRGDRPAIPLIVTERDPSLVYLMVVGA